MPFGLVTPISHQLLTGKVNRCDVSSGGQTFYLPSNPATSERDPIELVVEQSDSTSNVVTIFGSIRGAANSSVTIPSGTKNVRFAQVSNSWWPVASSVV